MAIKKLYNDFKKGKLVLYNVFHIACLKGINSFYPILIVPYLVKTIGADGYGLIIWIHSIMSVFLIVVDFGFTLSATRKLPSIKSNNREVSKLFSAISIIRFMLVAIGWAIMWLFLSFGNLSKTDNQYWIWIFYGLWIAAEGLVPIWFFQGLMKTQFLNYFNLVSKIVLFGLIFLFVKDKNNVILVPLFEAFAQALVLILSTYIVVRRFDIRFLFPGIENLKTELKDGWQIFMGTFLEMVIAQSGAVFLGFYATKEIVGIYGAIIKITRAFQGIFVPINQAIFPHISSVFTNEGVKRGIESAKNIGKYYIPFALLVLFIFMLISKKLLVLLFGSQFIDYVVEFRILIFWIFLGLLNNLFGVQILIASGNSKNYVVNLLISAILVLVLLIALVPKWLIMGVSVSMVFSEAILWILIVSSIYKKRFTVGV